MADEAEELRNPSHANSLFVALQKQWENQDKFCDLTIKVGDSQYKAHKFVLAAQSPYFKNILFENRPDVVELKEIDPQYFEKVLKYFYYGSMVSMKDIKEIIKLADYFAIDELKMYCTEYEYVHNELDTENCVPIFILADKYPVREERRCEILDFISKHIEEVSITDSFCNLSQNKLDDILKYSANGCAENLDNAIQKWVKHDEENRKDLTFDLVKIFATRRLEFIRFKAGSSLPICNCNLNDDNEV